MCTCIYMHMSFSLSCYTYVQLFYSHKPYIWLNLSFYESDLLPEQTEGLRLWRTGTSATSFPQCFARWPGVNRHSPEAALGTQGKVGPRQLKAAAKQNISRTTSSVRLFWGLRNRVTALVLMLSVFPRGEPTIREWNTNHGLSKGAQRHGKPSVTSL